MIVAAALAALLVGAAVAASDGPSTTVAAPRSAEIDDASTPLTGDALSLAAPEDALAGLGVTVAHDGGPLAPGRLLVRGLSGARLAASFDDVALDDPSGHHFDVALLPWAFADDVTIDSGPGAGLAGALRLRSARGEGPALRARVLAGGLHTARAAAMASTPLPEGRLTLGVEGGTSRGDFPFRPTGAAGAEAGPPLRRDNNDQRRASAMAQATSALGEARVDATALLLAHEGGIPGFALAPTRSLRGQDGLVAGRLAVSAPVQQARVGAAWGARAAHRATSGPQDPRAAVQSTDSDVVAYVRGVPLGDGVVADVQAHGGGARAVAAGDIFERWRAGAGLVARAALGPVRLRVTARGDTLSDTLPLVGGEVRVETGEALRGSLSLARSTRAPSLEERYAPGGFVVGNPALAPELAHEVEAAVAFRPGRILSARAVAFAGRLDDAIVYVNRNAYEVAPENTGAAWRAGVEATANVEPHELLGIHLGAAGLASRLDATGAPLPLAPPWSSRTALRVGAANALSLQAVVRARGPTTSNHFGTLVAPPVALLDVAARTPLAPGLWLSGAITNLLDVQDARDQNQLPLPGRLFFIAVEVSS